VLAASGDLPLQAKWIWFLIMYRNKEAFMLQMTSIGSGFNPAWAFATGGGKPDDQDGKKEDRAKPR